MGKKLIFDDEQGNSCDYFDTNDPYSLRAEAQEARDLLATNFVSGMEFAGDDGQIAFYNAMTRKSFGMPVAVCSVGAVYYVQGHHSHHCNLIQALDAKAEEIHRGQCADCDCVDECQYSGHETIIDVNDNLGRDAALAVFDAVIADYKQQCIHAEYMAQDYQRQAEPVTTTASKPFTYSQSTPINYGPAKTTAAIPVESKVKA